MIYKIEQAQDTNYAISFVEQNAEGGFVSKELFRITADGTLVKGPAFTTIDEASWQFWRAVEETAAISHWQAGSGGAAAPASKVEAPGIDYSGPKFLCPMHGETAHVFTSDIPGFEGHWCLKCAIANLERLRISKVEPVK
jgi:hypothetical protein